MLDCEGFTYTQGGWGAEPSGNNPGVYLHANFATAFPSGMQIGSQVPGAASDADISAGNQAALFTSAQAVTDWLPHGGPSGALGGDTVDPSADEDPDDGTLAAQTAALTLSVVFDAYDESFSVGAENLGDMVVASGPFAGQTVQFVLDTANAILSGATTGYTAEEANEAATAINENFDNGVQPEVSFVNCEDDPVDANALVTIEVHKFQDNNGDGIWNGADAEIGWDFTVMVGSFTYAVTTGTPEVFDGNSDLDTLDIGDATFDGNVLIVTVDDEALALGIPWSVTEADVAGWTQTTLTNASGTLTTAADSTGPLDFGNFENIDISGLKYTDANGDGSLAGDSPGTPGQTFTINLYMWTDAGAPGDGLVQGSELEFVATTETDADCGDYSFTNLGPLPAGTLYYVSEEGESGWTQTLGNDGYTTLATSGDDDTDNDFGNFENVCTTGHKFYDANLDSIDNDGQVVAGVRIVLKDANGIVIDTAYTDANGNYTLGDLDDDGFCDLGPGIYTVEEVLPNPSQWMQTFGGVYTVTVGGDTGGQQSGQDATGRDFGNACLGAGGGKTLGFWSNKNGYNRMNDAGGVTSELMMLNNLNLVKADGTEALFMNYGEFRTWILGARATNMAYMLSAQLAAMALNVEAGLVGGDSLVYTSSMGFITIEDLMDQANDALLADGLTMSGDANRAFQASLKDALDFANNNKNFILGTPCPVIYV